MIKAKKLNRAVALILALVMSVSCFCVTALAANTHATSTMSPQVAVNAVGAKSFYKIDNGSVSFADTDDGSGWTAVPSAYISGSEYNDGNVAYGAYVTDDKVHFVALTDCIQDATGNYFYVHGTEESAAVSSDVDETAEGDNQIGTEFWLRVEKGLSPDGPSVDVTVDGATADERINYEIVSKVKTNYQLDATVPMYVCMYGYAGDGEVVTPTSDAYKIKNYSTITQGKTATITDIVKLTTMTKIIDTEHSDENLAAIAYNATTGAYMWWYSMPTDAEFAAFTDWTINKDIADENLNASGECYVIYVDDTWTFKTSGVLDNGVLRQTVAAVEAAHPLKANFTFNGFDFATTTPSVGLSANGTSAKEGLAVKITELQALPATWKLVPVNTGVSEIKRGELAMSIAPSKAIQDASAVDLAACSAPIDITNRGWYLGKPTIAVAADNTETITPTELPLITSARMAGGNVNARGCTSVVKVIYTVTPMFAIDDGQTETVEADAVESNLLPTA